MKPIYPALCLVLGTACSEEQSQISPTLTDTQNATLRYANCVNKSAEYFSGTSMSDGAAARQAIDSCTQARAEALTLKSVPRAFSTVNEFDDVHFRVAEDIIKRSKD